MSWVLKSIWDIQLACWDRPHAHALRRNPCLLKHSRLQTLNTTSSSPTPWKKRQDRFPRLTPKPTPASGNVQKNIVIWSVRGRVFVHACVGSKRKSMCPWINTGEIISATKDVPRHFITPIKLRYTPSDSIGLHLEMATLAGWGNISALIVKQSCFVTWCLMVDLIDQATALMGGEYGIRHINNRCINLGTKQETCNVWFHRNLSYARPFNTKL